MRLVAVFNMPDEDCMATFAQDVLTWLKDNIEEAGPDAVLRMVHGDDTNYLYLETAGRLQRVKFGKG